MSAFYLVAVLLVLAAIAGVSFPWWAGRSRKAAGSDSKSQANTLSNTQLIKQRLEELQMEQQQGLLDEDALLHAQQELKLALLDEVEPLQSKGASPVVALVLGLVLSVAVAGGVYFHANQIQGIQNWQAAIGRLPELGKRIVVEADQSIQADDLQDFALGLRSRLADQAEDATGWMLLGRVLSALNMLDSAVQAYQRSLQIEPNNTGALVSYSQALMMMGQERGIWQAKDLLLRTLKLEPEHTSAMGMLALVAAQLGDKDLAIKNWQTLQGFVPQSDPSYASIEQRIAQLSENQDPTALQMADVNTIGDPTVISISIKLDEALKNKLPADGFLFVFAQDASGAERMPAAVVKTRLAELPITIELSDANAMMANYKLSQLADTRLVARISGDEDVAKAAGELQGEVLVTVHAGSHSEQQITINEEIL